MSTTIRVGAAPEAFRGTGTYLDGDTPLPIDVGFQIAEETQTLRILTTDGDLAFWPLDQIRLLRDTPGDAMILRHADGSLGRLEVTRPEDVAILRARCANLTLATPFPRTRRIWVWAAGAIGSVALMIFVLIPLLADQLAPFLPPAGERALGDTTLEQIRAAFDETGLEPLPICEGEAGLAAFAKMEGRLRDGSPDIEPITLTVLDHPLVNAFALPGGHVVFFRGLLEEASAPDQIAAVLAHEMGHVDAHDPTRIALRSSGSIGVLGLLLGDFAGGAVVLFLTNRLISADYTQEAEAAADAFAHEVLLAADVSPAAIADLFDLVAPDGQPTDGTIFQHFLSHPEIGDRIANARAAVPEGAVFRPVLTDDEFEALVTICE